jgi:hypothetical protein
MTIPAAMNPYPNAPVPVGATNVDEWDDVGKPEAFRLFKRKVWEHSAYSVYVQGTQLADGSVEEIVIKTNLHSDDDLSPRDARRVAAALIAAADEVDRMTR